MTLAGMIVMGAVALAVVANAAMLVRLAFLRTESQDGDGLEDAWN